MSFHAGGCQRPKVVTTDNGPLLTSAEFSDFLASRGIKHIRTVHYHLQANGGVERFNGTLKNGIHAHLTQGCTFEVVLNQTVLRYRESPHCTTQVLPALRMLCRELELPLLRFRAPNKVLLTQTQETVATRQQGTKEWVDQRRRARPPSIQVSDWVRTRRPQCHNKMASFWSQPRQSRRLLGPATFLLDDSSRWHASRLRKVPAPLPNQAAAVPAHLPPSLAIGTHPDPPPTPAPDPGPPPDSTPRQESVVLDQRPVQARICLVALEDFVTTYHT